MLYVGSSNFAGWHVVQANEAARRRGSLGLVSEQSLYNLNARMVELEVLPACQAYGVGIIPWSPLGGGLLGGALRKVTEGRRAGERVQTLVEDNRDKLEAWESLCAELGEDPADVALAWLLHQPAVTAPIIGPRTAEQLAGALPRPGDHARARTRSMPSTRSSPVPAAPPPRPTPGRTRPGTSACGRRTCRSVHEKWHAARWSARWISGGSTVLAQLAGQRAAGTEPAADHDVERARRLAGQGGRLVAQRNAEAW